MNGALIACGASFAIVCAKTCADPGVALNPPVPQPQLTYKPGTDTLRRSSSLEFCEWLVGNGARVRVHDPAVKGLPAAVAASISLSKAPLDAVREASALVVATDWPEYAAISASAIISAMPGSVILDPGRTLAKQVEGNPLIRYFTVGKS